MTAITASDLTSALAVIKQLSGVDWAGALAALENQNVLGDLNTVEQIAGALSPFLPGAQLVGLAAGVLSFAIATEEAGLWSPAQPEDPSMIRDNFHGVGRTR